MVGARSSRAPFSLDGVDESVSEKVHSFERPFNIFLDKVGEFVIICTRYERKRKVAEKSEKFIFMFLHFNER